jgi:N6-adenosine-specific RNA methylase IME4
MWEGLTPPYRTIVADPPWPDHPQAGGVKRGSRRALRHYSLMTLPEIEALPVGQLADQSCHLWLWTVNRLIGAGFDIARAWGFEPITVATWCKSGPGVGYYLRNNTEHAILGTRGKPCVPDSAAASSWFEWPRGAHSVKPAAFGDLVEQVSPGPYVELFAREPRFGWDSWGKGYEVAS